MSGAFPYDPELIPQNAAEFGLTLSMRAIAENHAILHELVETLASEAARLDARAAADRASHALDAPVPDSTRSAVEAVFDQFGAEMSPEFEAAVESSVESVGFDLGAVLGDPVSWLYPMIDVGSRLSEMTEKVAPLLGLEGGRDYLLAYMTAYSSMSRDPLFLRSALTVIVSGAEARMKSIVERHLELTEKLAASPARIARVRKLFSGNLDKWATALLSCGLDLSGCSTDWAATVEVFARRNAHVHHNGVVDASYREQTGSDEVDGLPLFLTREYLGEAIDLLAGMLMGLLFQVRISIHPVVGSGLASVVSHELHDHLRHRCYRYAENLAVLVERHSSDPETAFRAMVNRLIARARRLGVDSVRADFETLSTEGLPQSYELVRLVMLEEDDRAKPLFRQLRAEGELSDDDVRVWDAFQRWRDSGELDDTGFASDK